MPVTVKAQVLQSFATEVGDREAKLQALLDQIQRYGKVVNLTGSLETDALWREFAEAILGYRALQALGLSRNHWIDIGSGGGLPGLLFGILLQGTPNTSGVLIEPRKRRADFLRLTIAQLAIPNLRVAQATLDSEGTLSQPVQVSDPDWVSARAVFAPETWLERAAKAWPAARCMVHGSASAPSDRVLEERQSWSDHCVEMWGPATPTLPLTEG